MTQHFSRLGHTPSTEETLLGGGVLAWAVVGFLLLGCLCPFLHHLIVFPFLQ